MRYLLFLLLSTTTLFAQDAPTSSDKYVWAKSGLILRAEGNPKGEKLAVIPYGSVVQLTGEWGEDFSVEVVPERDVNGKEITGWEMLGQFVGVQYGDLKGYAFNGYICNYDPEPFTLDSLSGTTTSKVSIVDTLHSLQSPVGSEYGELSLLYNNGITISRSWSKVDINETIVVPNATLATGYLLAAKWYNLDDYDPNHRDWENAYLISKTHDSLTFKRDLEEVTIKEYFGVVIILYSVSC